MLSSDVLSANNTCREANTNRSGDVAESLWDINDALNDYQVLILIFGIFIIIIVVIVIR